MMSKDYYFKIPPYQKDHFFQYIKKKSTVISILLRALKYMSSYKCCNKNETGDDYILLKISKESRIYFFSKEKYYTLSFPFSVLEADHQLSFKLKHYNADITNEDIYFIENVVCNEMNGEIDRHKDIEKMLDSTLTPLQKEFLVETLLAEEGYMRFDKDEANQNGHIHPLLHVDTFYRDYNKAKFGLFKELTPEDFVGIFDQDIYCLYLKDPRM